MIRNFLIQVRPYVRMKNQIALILLLLVIATVVNIKIKLELFVQNLVDCVKKVRSFSLKWLLKAL